MAYEKVSSGSNVGSAASPMVSVRQSETIGINQAALDEFFEDVEYIEVYYDDDNNCLGLLPLEEETEDSYTLSRSDSGGTVSPSSFLRSKELVPDITTQYEPFNDDLDEDVELVSIDLEEPIGTYGSPNDQEDE